MHTDNQERPKRKILENIGKIDTVEQLHKAMVFITTTNKSGAYQGSLSCAVKKLWWEFHEYNKDNLSDFDWVRKQYTLLKPNKYTKCPLTQNDIKCLLKRCRTNKQRLFILTLFSTGLRISEMTSIQVSDCRTNGKYISITVIAKKTKRSIEPKLSHKLFNNIREEFAGKKYLFETGGGKAYRPEYISMQIKKIGKLMNMNISAHTLRHSHITNRINNGEDLIEISRSVGHINPGSIINNYYTGL